MRVLERSYYVMQACLGLTTVQKVTAIMKRNHFYVTLGGVLHAREKLLKQLEAAAVGITLTADCEIMECLGRPQPASQEAMSLLARVKLSMDHQRYLIRNFIYELNMEIMSPIQFAIFMVWTNDWASPPPPPPPPRAFPGPVAGFSTCLCLSLHSSTNYMHTNASTGSVQDAGEGALTTLPPVQLTAHLIMS